MTIFSNYHKIIWLLVKAIIFLVNITNLFSQTFLNSNSHKILISEYLFNNNLNSDLNTEYPIQITYNHKNYYNSNLPNLENHNGLYIPKGIGNISSFLFQYKTNNILISAEPSIRNRKEYNINIPIKSKQFSVLNDVPIINNTSLRNFGIKVFLNNYFIGIGNWDQWWGPGIHNSLVMSNNSLGNYFFKFGNKKYSSIKETSIQYKFNYMSSSGMKNTEDQNYFLSAWFLKLKYNVFVIGLSRNILSGGYKEIAWNKFDALNVLFTNNKLKYWNQIYDLFLLYDSKSTGLKIFYELGIPSRTFNGKNPKNYTGHAIGSNLGIRKQGAFGSKNLIIGFEYTRLIQSIYYDIIPTPNWYDNHRFNYSSFKGRRWSSHSGSDSDDFLVFIGYLSNKIGFVYGINYERHGVTYHFPPEVKLESRISFSYKLKNTFIYINYEYEYFEHYGFVDNNKNVWDQTFESNSIQRTNTLLFSLERKISF